MKGWIFKVGDFVKSWKKRYLVHESTRLAYYESPGGSLKGEIPMFTVTEVYRALECPKQPAFAVATPKRVFYFVTEFEEDADKWVADLGAKIGPQRAGYTVCVQEPVAGGCNSIKRMLETHVPSGCVAVNNESFPVHFVSEEEDAEKAHQFHALSVAFTREVSKDRLKDIQNWILRESKARQKKKYVGFVVHVLVGHDMLGSKGYVDFIKFLENKGIPRIVDAKSLADPENTGSALSEVIEMIRKELATGIQIDRTPPASYERNPFDTASTPPPKDPVKVNIFGSHLRAAILTAYKPDDVLYRGYQIGVSASFCPLTPQAMVDCDIPILCCGEDDESIAQLEEMHEVVMERDDQRCIVVAVYEPRCNVKSDRIAQLAKMWIASYIEVDCNSDVNMVNVWVEAVRRVNRPNPVCSISLPGRRRAATVAELNEKKDTRGRLLTPVHLLRPVIPAGFLPDDASPEPKSTPNELQSEVSTVTQDEQASHSEDHVVLDEFLDDGDGIFSACAKSVKHIDMEDITQLGQSYFTDGDNRPLYKVSDNTASEPTLYLMKQPSKLDMEDEDALDVFKAFRSEFVMLASVQHPCICKLVGWSGLNKKPTSYPVDASEYPRLFLEYKEKGTFREAMGTLDPTQKLIVLIGTCMAMSYLHTNGIMHRELKPDNILLDENFHPGLIDFLSSKKGEVSSTEIIRHSIYTAPEMCKSETYTGAVDMYAFGMILYESLVGGKTLSALEAERKQRGPEWRPDFPDDTDEKVAALIQACWCENPAERPAFESIAASLIDIAKEDTSVDVKDIEDFLENNNLCSGYLVSSLRGSHLSLDNIDVTGYVVEATDYEYLEDDRKKIGQGTTCKVYKVRNKATGLICAQKRYEKLSVDNVRRFDNEVRSLIKVSHPCIIRMFGFCPPKDGIGALMFMELLDTDLGKAMATGLTPTQKLIILYGIAVGMNAMHEANIVHRDLKPDNIMLDKEKHPRIADMGLAREPALDMTMGAGTPKYEAPEVLNGDSQYTSAVDIYSYGIICYEMITGKDPVHELPCRQNWIVAIRNGTRPKIPATTSEEARKLINDCWNTVPEQRPTAHSICSFILEHAGKLMANANLDAFNRYCESIK